MKFVELSRDEYDVFQKAHPLRCFSNSLKAAEFRERQHATIYFVGLKDNDNILCAASLSSIPVMRIFTYIDIQRGMLIDYDNIELVKMFSEEIANFVKTKKALFMHMDPNVFYQERDIHGDIVENGFEHKQVVENLKSIGWIHDGFTIGNREDRRCRFMSTLYLENKDEEQILKDMNSQAKRSTKKVLKSAIELQELNVDEIDTFYNMLVKTGERRDFGIREKDYYVELLKTYGKDAKLLAAYLDVDKQINIYKQEIDVLEKQQIEIAKRLADGNKKAKRQQDDNLEAIKVATKHLQEVKELESKYGKLIVMASALFIMQPDEITYLFSAAYTEFKKYNAPYALQWEMITYGLKHKYKRYNFYGISGNFNKDAEDYGVFEFKRGFHATVEELVGDFHYPIRKTMYKIYNFVK